METLWRFRVKVFVLVSVLAFVSSSVYAASTTVEPSASTYDFAILLSSLVAFVFRQFFNLLTLIEDGILSLAGGNENVPIFGSIYRAMKYAGMIEYQIPAGIQGQDTVVTNIVCHVSLKLLTSLKLLVLYVEDNIQNGYFPGVIRNFMEYLDIELQKYAFYNAWCAFVTNLPSYKFSELLANFFH